MFTCVRVFVCRAMWRRSLHEKFGYFDASFQPYSDHLLWLRAIAAGESAVKQSGPAHALVLRTSNSGNDGDTPHAHTPDERQAERRVFELMKFHLHQGLRPLNIVLMHETASAFSGGDARVVQMLRFLAEQGHHVFYISRLPLEANGVAIIEQHVVAYSLHDPQLHAVADWMEMGITFDVAIMSTWFYMPLSIVEVIAPRFRAKSPRTVLVALTDDIHSIRRPQMGQFKCCAACTDPPTTGADLDLCNLSLDRELTVYRSVDLVLTIADEDATTLRSLIHRPEPLVEVFPFVEHVSDEPPSIQDRQTVLWCAAFHTANEIAFQWFVRFVWPRFLERVPYSQSKLVVIGKEWQRYSKDIEMEVLVCLCLSLSLSVSRLASLSLFSVVCLTGSAAEPCTRTVTRAYSGQPSLHLRQRRVNENSRRFCFWYSNTHTSRWRGWPRVQRG